MKKGTIITASTIMLSLLGGCGLMTKEGTPAETDKSVQNSKYPTEQHMKAHKSLSPKNQQAYDSLSTCDQNRVVETYKRGGNHQKTLNQILKEDQYYNAPRRGSVSADTSTNTDKTEKSE